MNLDEFESLLWKLWTDVHDGIGPIRNEAYKILGHLPPDKERQDVGENLTHCYECKLIPQDDSPEKLSEFAQEGFTCARAFQNETEKISYAKAKDVLQITTKAGVLLYYTEQVLLRYKGLKEQAKSSDKPLPINYDVSVLSATMTTIATARDHILAAEGHIKNLKEGIGSNERRLLLGRLLLPTIIVYVLFHPSLQLLYLLSRIPSIPPQYRIYWEVVFWSLFGAISISFITISEDVMKDAFDPRHVYWYEYRIAVAPFVTVVLVLFVSLVGITSVKLDIANPNLPVVVLLSFLFGFFGKRSLDLLNDVWQRLFPSATAEESKETTRGSTKSSGHVTPSP